MKQSLGAKIIVGATTVWVIGTYDGEGRPNFMTAAWGGVCCSDPPCLGVSLRKATYSYAAIAERKAFTVNIPPRQVCKGNGLCGDNLRERYGQMAGYRSHARAKHTCRCPLCGGIPSCP